MKIVIIILVCFNSILSLSGQNRHNYSEISDSLSFERLTQELTLTFKNTKAVFNLDNTDISDVLCAGLHKKNITILLQDSIGNVYVYGLLSQENTWINNYFSIANKRMSRTLMMKKNAHVELIDINTFIVKYELENNPDTTSIYRLTKNGLQCYEEEASKPTFIGGVGLHNRPSY